MEDPSKLVVVWKLWLSWDKNHSFRAATNLQTVTNLHTFSLKVCELLVSSRDYHHNGLQIITIIQNVIVLQYKFI